MDSCPDCGSRRPYRGLTVDDVRELRAARARGETQVALAARFNVSRGTARAVIAGGDKVCKRCAALRSWQSPSDKQDSSRDIARGRIAEVGRAHQGRTLSPEHREKLSKARQGRTPSLGMKHTARNRARWSAMKKGKVRDISPDEHARRSAGAHRRWGTTPAAGATRGDLSRWAYNVIKRDHGRCVACAAPKTTRKSIQAHHILSKSKHPEFALLLNNGITLCAPCHRSEHSLNGII